MFEELRVFDHSPYVLAYTVFLQTLWLLFVSSRMRMHNFQ